MSEQLPSCMMPDGAEPCEGYTDLLAERDFLLADSVRTVDLITEIMKQDDGKGYMEAMKDSEVVRLQAKIKQLEEQLEEERQENASLRSGSIDDYERGAE